MYSTMARTIGSSERSELDIDSTITNGIMKKVGSDVGIWENEWWLLGLEEDDEVIFYAKDENECWDIVRRIQHLIHNR